METNNPSPGDYPHYLLRNASFSEEYTYPGRPYGSSGSKERNRQQHGQKLNEELSQASEEDRERKDAAPAGMDVGEGIYIQFESDPGYELNLDRLESTRYGIEVTAVKLIPVETEDGEEVKTAATVYVPEGQLEFFFTRIEEYLENETPTGYPSHSSLIDTIGRIKLATLEAFWTEPTSSFPDQNQEIWWEAWLRKGENDDGQEELITQFREQAERADLRTKANSISFPENSVLLIQGTPEALSTSVLLLDCLSEVRRTKTIADFFLDLTEQEQEEAARELLDRTTFADDDAPAVCLLDSGVNRGHPLLAEAADPTDMDSYDPTWGTADDHEHGTLMAGLSLYGNMETVLNSVEPVRLEHRIESVKILPPQGQNEPELYGEITEECIARAEVNAPYRNRVFCMAVTSEQTRDQGRPSSWSGAVDKAAYGDGPDSDDKRLIFVSSGNTWLEHEEDFPDQNETDGIHDPAQAWNAITVGSYTEKTTVDPDRHPEWRPIAEKGSLSPCATTSLVWNKKQWPRKPDVVMEGGNMSVDRAGRVIRGPDSLRLVTTNDSFQRRGLFAPMGDTSASAALASRLGVQITQSYPTLRPETVRGLIIHSAEWNSQMLSEVADTPPDSVDPRNFQREQKENLLRRYGHGVPNIATALRNARNSLTLLSEDSLQPFERNDGGDPTSKDLNLHDLPWPKQVLQELGDTQARMKVTLSYFIEPNPGRKGYQYGQDYASTRLRYRVKSPTESLDEFRAKINRAAQNEENDGRGTRDYSNWMLGPTVRTKGSIHSDTWWGPSAELAEQEKIAVHPVSGWWKTRSSLERWDDNIRYSLIVSIRTEEEDVDIYNAIPVTEPVRILQG